MSHPLAANTKVVILSILVAIAALTLSATASAEVVHPFLQSITEANGEPLDHPWGLAVDGTGNLFVGDAGNQMVDKYDAANGFSEQFSGGEDPECCGIRSVAVDNATGVVYVGEDELEPRIRVYAPRAGGGYELLQTVPTEGFDFVTVDNSSGPRKGGVYAIEFFNAVSFYKTNAAGELETSSKTSLVPPPGNAEESFHLLGFGSVEGAGGLTVDSATGQLYLAEPEPALFAGGAGMISVYSPEGVFEKQITAAETPTPGPTTFRPISVAVDTASGDVYAADVEGKVVDEFSSEGKYLGQITDVSEGEPFSSPLGVAVQNAPGASRGNIYVSDGARVDIFAGSRFPLTVKREGAGAGTGEVISTPAGIECGTTCSAEFDEGSEVELKETGGHFEGWSGGGCSGTGPCKVTLTEATEVTAKIGFSTTSPLNVFVTGEGTVTSTPAGITACGPSSGTCTAEFEGEVTLQATPTPGSGYIFVGWLGCKRATVATTCTLDMTAPSEVTAVFLKEGTEGEEGQEGEQGRPGKEGKAGKEGAPGTTGAQGATGANGPGGATGAPGPAGPAGPTGATGPAGPAGKIELVKCKTVKHRKKKVQRCATQLLSGPVTFKAAGASAHATLARHGHVYASGTARSTARGRMSLQLIPVRRLRPGSYTLTLVAGSGHDETIRTESFTLR